MKRSLMLGCAATLALAGCGSSGGSSSSSTPSSTAAPATNAAATTPATSAYGGVSVLTKHGKLGTILAAGPKKLTVYLFQADSSGSSACSGACAKAWPPVLSTGSPVAASGALAGDLGTIKRPDGTTQVTYAGHPLYYFAGDTSEGDAFGQGSTAFGAGWYVLTPSGSAVGASTGGGGGGTTTATSSGSGGW
jgi:predicted lipoprotein with Yx(FWY)xxD motif